ncbi:MAG: arsenate reductase (azurin) large subunit, partial [Myxococcota bacterium]
LRLDVPYARVLAEASRFTEIPIALIVTAARWMAEPKSATTRRRTLTYYEKGVIWNHRNLDTVAAVVQLSALAGNLGRPGTGCSRQGGHQEGYVRPPYPGPRPPPNVDAWLARGGGRLFWVMGSNPFLSTPGATEFARSMTERVRRVDHALTSAGASKSSRAKRIREALSSGDGLFMVVSELYPTATAKAAHLILPAAGWGEMDLTSISCHGRLLRLYSAFMDPPGEARPDWAIAAGVARAVRKLYLKRGRTKDARRFAGFDWKEAEDVFLAGGETFPDNRVDASGGDQLPAECYRGVTYDRLRELGQTGIPTPVRQDPKSGELVGTVRRYTHRFNTSDGRFRWHGSAPWDGHPAAVEKYLSGTRARKHPFWLTNGRTQRWWQTGFHDALDEDKRASVPYPFVEVHPEDARELRIETGDLVALFNEEGRETFQARIAHSTKRGVLFALQYHARGSSNALVSTSAVDPTTTIPYYKGTRVGLSRLSTRPDAKPSKIAPNVLE